MHCASCANIIEKTFKKTDGVESVEVNYGTEKAKISYDEIKISPQDLSKKIEPLGYSLDLENHDIQSAEEMGMSAREHSAHLGLNQSKKEKLAEVAVMKAGVLTAIPIAVFAALVMGWDILAQYEIVSMMNETAYEFVHHLMPILATYILFVIGKPYLLGFYRFLRYGKANMDTLIGIGTVAAFLYSFAVTAFEEVLKPFINVE
jgi:P-type Cu+ transporter